MTQAQAEFRDAKAFGRHLRQLAELRFRVRDMAKEITEAHDAAFEKWEHRPGFMEGYNG